MPQNQCWKIDKAGSFNRLHLFEETLPPPEPEQVQISIKAIGLNFADLFACLGLYSATPKGAFTPGLEFSGEISGLPASPSKGNFWKIGDKVIGVTRFGAYTKNLNVDANYLFPLPKEWSFAEGAAFPAQGLTAWYGLKTLGHLQPEELVLVHSAAGGVGLLALEIIKATGAKVVGTVGSYEKVDFLKKHTRLHQDQIIVRERKKFSQQLRNSLQSLKRDGFDIIFDAVYGDYFKPAYQALKPGGRHILFGAATMMTPGNRPNYLKLAYQYLKRPKLDPLMMIPDNKSLIFFNLIWLWERTEEMQQMQKDFFAIVQKPPYIGHTFPFEEALNALKLLQSGKTHGKVILLT